MTRRELLSSVGWSIRATQTRQENLSLVIFYILNMKVQCQSQDSEGRNCQENNSGLRFRTNWAEVENLPSVNHVSTRGSPNWSPVLFCPHLSEEDSVFWRLGSSGSLARQWGINIHIFTEQWFVLGTRSQTLEALSFCREKLLII